MVDPVPILLDKPRTLLFTKGAVKQAEQALAAAWGGQCTFYSVLRDLTTLCAEGDLGYLNFSKLSLLVWAGLQHEDALSQVQVEDLLPHLDMARLVEVAALVLQAWMGQSPAPDPAVNGEASPAPDPLAASPGPPSGALSVASLA